MLTIALQAGGMATPASGYQPDGWTGACTGTGPCSVSMTAARTVRATFGPRRYTLTVTPPTHGTITGTGIACGTGGSDCTQDHDFGAVVALTATPDTGYRLRTWAGACTGTGPCPVTMTQARTVGATFAIQRFTLTVTPPTNGTITATGINCGTGGSDCCVSLASAVKSTAGATGNFTWAMTNGTAASILFLLQATIDTSSLWINSCEPAADTILTI